MIYLIAIIKAKAEAAKDLEKLFQPLVTTTRSEAGCHRYELHQDLKEQTTYIMMEEWADESALKAHEASTHFKDFVIAAKNLLSEPMFLYQTEKLI